MENKELLEKINKGIEKIRPYLQEDGGDINIVKIEEDIVYIEFKGNCKGCSINQTTLKSGVEYTIKKYAPEIKKVIDINHISYE